MLAIPLRDVRRDLASCKLRRKLADRKLIGRELELCGAVDERCYTGTAAGAAVCDVTF